MLSYYVVAGHRFSLLMEDGSLLWSAMDKYEPFKTEGGTCVFSLEVRRGEQSFDKKLLYVQKGKEQEQRLEVYSCGDAMLIEMAPVQSAGTCGQLLYKPATQHGELFVWGGRALESFALDNALMTLYAFSTATLRTLELHSSVTLNAGRAYLFLGKSGTGKSTHSRLWLENVPGSTLLNDDNPVLRVLDDGSVWVYGSPWSGKTPCYKNQCAPVGAIVRIRQASQNSIARLGVPQAYASLSSSCSGYRPDKKMADGMHETLAAAACVVPSFLLDCLPDAAAAILCSENVR